MLGLCPLLLGKGRTEPDPFGSPQGGPHTPYPPPAGSPAPEGTHLCSTCWCSVLRPSCLVTAGLLMNKGVVTRRGSLPVCWGQRAWDGVWVG